MGEVKKAKEKGKGPLKTIIITAVVFIVVLCGAFASYTLFFSKSTAKSNTLSNLSSGQGFTSAKTYSLDECLVNLTDEGGKNYLQVTIYLGYENSSLAKELETKKPIIRDAVISILRSKSTADFNSNGTDKIKTEIINKINPLLTNGQIDKIYFDNLLVQ
jgi:flagellar protein FliL